VTDLLLHFGIHFTVLVVVVVVRTRTQFGRRAFQSVDQAFGVVNIYSY